ncbi:MAG: hypothetical protein K5848_06245 [Lachnospiraceae bacterium]|nr:hypothetical protein [Lachnospiraceae bacterium]
MDEKLKKQIKKWAISALTVIVIVVLMAVFTELFGEKEGPGNGSSGSNSQVNSGTTNVEQNGEDSDSEENGDNGSENDSSSSPVEIYSFRTLSQLNDHFDKHGDEFGYLSATQYQAGANAVINNPNSLHKTEAEDGDDIYYLEESNELVVLSTDGYIRTYFKPSAGIDYYNRQ